MNTPIHLACRCSAIIGAGRFHRIIRSRGARRWTGYLAKKRAAPSHVSSRNRDARCSRRCNGGWITRWLRRRQRMKSNAPCSRSRAARTRSNSSSTVRRIAGRFVEGQADFHEFPSMSHWLVGEPEAPEVARLCTEWLARRGLSGEAPRKSRRALGVFGAPVLSD